MPNKLQYVHPRNYGPDSRPCRLCKNLRGKNQQKKLLWINLKHIDKISKLFSKHLVKSYRKIYLFIDYKFELVIEYSTANSF